MLPTHLWKSSLPKGGSSTVVKRRRKNPPANVDVGPCLRCNQCRSPERFPGPDGERTLCSPCFTLYKKKRVLLYFNGTAKTSIRRFPDSFPVLQYDFQAGDSHGGYLNPVVLQYYSHNTFGTQEILGTSRELRKDPKSEPQTDQGGSVASKPADESRPETLQDMEMKSRADALSPHLDSNSVSRGYVSVKKEDSLVTVLEEETIVNAANPEQHVVAAGKRQCLSSGSASAMRRLEQPTQTAVTGSTRGMRSLEHHARVTLGACTNGTAEAPTAPQPTKNSREESVAKVSPTRGKLSVKASFNSQCGTHLARRYTIQTDVSFKSFRDELREIFNISSDCVISYKDEDGDDVAITSNNEFKEMFAVVRKHSISPIRIQVTPLRT